MFKVTCYGNLTKDPVLNESGCCRASIAVRLSRKKDNQQQSAFVDANIWGRMGEAVAKYLKKGDPIIVTGNYFPSIYIGRDGQARMSHSIDNADVAFVSRGRDGNANAAPQPEPQSAQADALDDDEELPF